VASLAANKKNITTDESALLAFKSLITSDPYHILANNWSSSYSVCTWYGVTCDERHNRVHSLILNNTGLRGTISPNLENLSFLVIFDLRNNSFSDQFPKEIFRLRRLKVLDISHNKFVGEIPASLGDLYKLQHLYLGGNNFSGSIPQSISNLRRMKFLDAGQNRLSGPIPQSIWKLSSLEYINLAHNYFSGNTSHDTSEYHSYFLRYFLFSHYFFILDLQYKNYPSFSHTIIVTYYSILNGLNTVLVLKVSLWSFN
jgi:LRR receptor-like serine/threonine-protein kinase FLS2